MENKKDAREIADDLIINYHTRNIVAISEAAAELRRLHTANVELVKALKKVNQMVNNLNSAYGSDEIDDLVQVGYDLIAKHGNQS